ncbi:hypothetical protein Syun_029880 [Stephania yunnanensis]|uniref:Uncharacterized protein n=1 Tax=Stephania yunnanensis TaxID=152371 RepID=A0AAP0E6F4_9MAGN
MSSSPRGRWGGRGAGESARRWWSSFLAVAREGDWYSTMAVVLSKRALAEAVAEQFLVAAKVGNWYSSGRWLWRCQRGRLAVAAVLLKGCWHWQRRWRSWGTM